MKTNEEQIHQWQDRVRETYGSESKLYEYLFTTLENFFYRYLETSDYKGLKVSELKEKTFGAESFETSMVDALKMKNPAIHPGVLDLAKRIPKAQGPAVKLSLSVTIKELTSDRGDLVITAEVDWGFPDYTQAEKRARKEVRFFYDDLAVFRKQLALKIEEACELFN
jgi:hypothetical protein